MGTGSVDSLVLKWLGRLPTVPVPFFGLKARRLLYEFGYIDRRH